MPRFPVVDDEGCFDREWVVLTKPLLGFYVQDRPLDQVGAYADGLCDVCTLLDEALAKPETKEMSIEQFRQQIQDIIDERYELMTIMHDYITQTKAEKRLKRNPQ